MNNRGKSPKIGEEHYLLLQQKLITEKHWRLLIKGGKAPRFLPPRPLEGIYEDTLKYDPHHDWQGEVGLLHTSWLPVEKKWRKTGNDAIWPLITEYGKLVWHGEPCQRTEKGIVDAFTYTLIIEHEIDNRPACSLCNRMTHIEREYGTKDDYYHVCRSKDHPGKTVKLEFGFSLPEKLKDFLANKKKASQQYQNKNQRLSIDRVPAGVRRKKWIEIDSESALP